MLSVTKNNFPMNRTAQRRKIYFIIIRILIVLVFPLFLLSLLYYILEDYSLFIGQSVNTTQAAILLYSISFLRLYARFGYLIGLVGIWQKRNWGIVLMIIVWLLQLIPNFIYTTTTVGYSIDTLISFIELMVLCAATLPFWRFYYKSNIKKLFLVYTVGVIALHTILFISFV